MPRKNRQRNSQQSAARRDTMRVRAFQVAIAIAVLAAWQFLPQIHALSSRFHFLDSFFISSPTRVFSTLIDLMTGRGGSPVVWSYLWATLSASLVGTAIGMVAGGAVGLILSNSNQAGRVLGPYILGANAIPRIALIPIVILLVGPTFEASVVMCVMVVFFVAFFNAFEGGRTIEGHVIDNAALLGASKRQVMMHVRLPYVLAWTLAVLPLATTFGIITVVTGEIFTGYPGIGKLLYSASITGDSSVTFAVVIILSVLGLVVLAIADRAKGRILHWWGAQ